MTIAVSDGDGLGSSLTGAGEPVTYVVTGTISSPTSVAVGGCQFSWSTKT
jgi:hypothetical protein